jgi:hypothetical protein
MLSFQILQGQVSVKDSSIALSMLFVQGAYNISQLDLENRFGNYFSVGGGFQHKSAKNFLYKTDFNFLTGNTVKEVDMLLSISTPDTFLIGADGTLYDARTMMRGFQGSFQAGKLIPVLGPNPNSGITLLGGVGFMQHKIRIDPGENVPVPQLLGDYKKGYDRLSNGLFFSGSLGYFYLSNYRLVNFHISINYQYGFLQNRRSWNFDENRQDTSVRRDAAWGFQFAWILPLFKKIPNDFYMF